MCNDQSSFNEINFCKSGSVLIANGDIIPITRYGKLEIKIANELETHYVMLEDVTFVAAGHE